MAKRRKSSSAGGLIAGAAGFVYVLLMSWFISKYLLVTLIALCIIAMIVAIIVATVKADRSLSPAVTQQPQEPPRPPAPVQALEPRPLPVPKPKSARTPKPTALDADELAAEMRAFKHASHLRAMEEWDREWILMAYPGKTSREISEIANAHFARGRSIGINYGDPSVPGSEARKPRKKRL